MRDLRSFRLLPDDPEVGRLPYLWLLYLGFVVIGPVFMGVTDVVWIWVGTGASILVFLPIYFRAYWLEGRPLLTTALTICALGAAVSSFNRGASTYFIFGAYFAGFSADRRWRGVQNVGLILATLLLTVSFIQPSPYFWVAALLGSLVVGILGVELRQRMHRTAHLRMARAEVDTLARIAERERIARDLHDLLGQSLSVVSLKAELAGRLLQIDPARAAAELKDIHDVARQSLSEVRTAVQGYRVGSGAGLEHELTNARRALRTAGVQLQCDDDVAPLARELDAEHEAVVALALREGVTNVVRHARASRCCVRFVVSTRAFGVEIIDDGRGRRGAYGAGLLGMRERVESLGGRLELRDRPGTTVRLTFKRRAMP